MKDSADTNTIDFVEELEAAEQPQSEFSAALTVISKITLSGLSKTDVSVLHSIIVDVSFDGLNDFNLNQTKLAESMNMKQPNIARSVKKLVSARMLKKLDNGNYQLIITEPVRYGE